MTADAYTIREANESDFAKIAAFFSKYNYRLDSEQSLRWKYSQNPVEQGRIFLMEDSQKQIKGTLGYIPHILFRAEARPIPVMASVDLFFCS
jgi:hypothetical protein